VSGVLGVIPARLGSERLPEKPLREVAGRPLLAWVWDRAQTFDTLDAVVVATDAPAIAELCDALGAPVMLTSPDHPSGTDRVAEVIQSESYATYDVIVNLQGDEPLLDADHVAAAVALVRDAGWALGTCATHLDDPALLHDPSVVKVARSLQGQALYFSRAAIPHRRDGTPTRASIADLPYYRHLGLYSYQRDALLAWVAAPPSPLELLERLEQLRALEAGLRMGVAVVGPAARGVDTPEDLAHLDRILRLGQTSDSEPTHLSAPQWTA
jgi:3-deoxy-manno-octulosonate cytidylyltransferase (CMP-KDO synthetase)